MKPFLLLILLGIFAESGLAAVNQDGPQERIFVVSTTMKVPAGQFQSLETAYPVIEGSNRTEIRLKMVKPNLGSDWAAMASFCIRQNAAQTRSNVCLQFFFSESRGEIQPRHLYRIKDESIPQIVTLAPSYKVGDFIAVSIVETNGRLEFLVNGESMFFSNNVKGPARLEFSCSSVVCSVDF